MHKLMLQRVAGIGMRSSSVRGLVLLYLLLSSDPRARASKMLTNNSNFFLTFLVCIRYVELACNFLLLVSCQ